MRTRLALLAAVAIVFLDACASSGGGTASASSSCELQPKDSVFAIHAPVFRDCAVTTRPRLITTDVRPDFTPPRAGCYSVQYEFVVMPSGFVDANTARLVKTNNQQLAEAYKSILPRLRFEPGKRDGVPVATITGLGTEMISKVVVSAPGSRPNPGRAGPGC